MKTRVVVEMLSDGHIIVDQQHLSHAPVSGNSHQRKLMRAALRRGEVELKWRRVNRAIYRHGVLDAQPEFTKGVEILPFGTDPEIRANAQENDAVADWYGMQASEQIAEFTAAAEVFATQKPKRVVVTITEVDE